MPDLEKGALPHSPEEVMKAFAKENEQASGINNPGAGESPAKKVQATNHEAFKQSVVAMNANKQTRQEAHAEEMALRRQEQHDIYRQGYIPLPIEDLPSGGIFYPEGTTISIRAASGMDIRNWSMMNESDLSDIDQALNNIISKCATISLGNGKPGSWKDLVEIDRLYVILAIRDFTFTDGHNDLKVVLNESEDLTVKKENISFIDLPDGLFKYFDSAKRGFVFPSDNPAIGEFVIYLPKTGVNSWLRSYMTAKREAQQPFDTDFIQIAPMLIADHNNLDERSYIALVNKSQTFSINDWSVLSYVKDTIEASVMPKVKYIGEDGTEREVPLNFRGGLKAIFILRPELAEKLGF